MNHGYRLFNLLAPLVGLALACNDPDDGSGSATETSGQPTTGQPTTGSAAGAPVVMELLSNPTELVAYKAITFTAIVSDPDGLDTIVAGKLVSPDGSAFYGAFASLGGGTYQLVMSWDMISAAAPIDFTGATQAREFKADFSDVDGNHATASITITLDCATFLLDSNWCNGNACERPAVCGGDCVDLASDREHCGKCGRDCGPGGGCYSSQCE